MVLMENSEIIPQKEIEQETASIVLAARALQVRDNETYVQAGTMLTTVKAAQKKVDAVFDPMIAAAYAAHKKVCATKKQFSDPLLESEHILKGRIVDYDDEQERKAQAEQTKLREMAKKLEDDRALLDAGEMEDAGRHAEAEERIAAQAAAPAPAIVLQRPTPKIQGLSFRENWVAELTDLMALVKAVAAGTVPLLALQANMAFLGTQARSMKGLLKYPGVTVISKKIPAAR